MHEFFIPDIFQNKLRLEIISCLISGEKSFKEVKNLTNATDGNISAQIAKMEEEKFISVKKQFINNKPRTTYQLTDYGYIKFKEYVNILERILKEKEV